MRPSLEIYLFQSIQRLNNISKSCKFVLSLLVNESRHGDFEETKKYISEKLGLCIKTVREDIKILEKYGYIQVKPRAITIDVVDNIPEIKGNIDHIDHLKDINYPSKEILKFLVKNSVNNVIEKTNAYISKKVGYTEANTYLLIKNLEDHGYINVKRKITISTEKAVKNIPGLIEELNK